MNKQILFNLLEAVYLVRRVRLICLYVFLACMFAAQGVHAQIYGQANFSRLEPTTTGGVVPQGGTLMAGIDRGDSFIILTDPASLPSVKGGYVPGSPNGYFTARELQYLNEQGIKPKYKPE